MMLTILKEMAKEKGAISPSVNNQTERLGQSGTAGKHTKEGVDKNNSRNGAIDTESVETTTNCPSLATCWLTGACIAGFTTTRGYKEKIFWQPLNNKFLSKK